MSSFDGDLDGLVGFGFFCIVAILVAIVLGDGLPDDDDALAAKHAAQTSALTPVSWTPCEAPRPDVECWHAFAVSQRVVVCLPLSSVEEKP